MHKFELWRVLVATFGSRIRHLERAWVSLFVPMNFGSCFLAFGLGLLRTLGPVGASMAGAGVANTCFSPLFDCVSDIEAVKKAVEWCSGRTSSEINSFRRSVISQVEKRAHAPRVQGGCSHWLSGAPASTQALAAEVNGSLLEELAAQIGFEDMDCIIFFRVGAFVFMGRACVLFWSFLSRPRCTIG